MALDRTLDELLQDAQAHAERHDWRTVAERYARAAAAAPHDRRLVNNQGHALWIADLPAAAEACYRRALVLQPHCPVALSGLGHVLRDLNRFEDAVAAYQAATRSADWPDAEWGLSQVLMGLEHYGPAYRHAEARQRIERWTPPFPPPFWGGQGLKLCPATSRLVIWSEQGLGDTFQYLRWIPALSQWRHSQAAARGLGQPGELTLLVPGRLVRLLREGLAWMERPPLVLEREGFCLEPGMAHGPLLSLPHELGGAPLPDPEGFPVLRSPLWGERRVPAGRPRVGLVWASGRKLTGAFTRREYQRRSLTAGALWELVRGLQEAGAEPVSLQFGADTELAAGLGLELAMPSLPIDDLANVARVVMDLDLVISVDTAMAHLVGSLGAPGWILLPWSADPRWLRERRDSPWYPSLRLYRQTASGAWSTAIEPLLAHFRQRCAAGAG